MKLEISSVFTTLALFTSFTMAPFAHANSAGYLQSLLKRFGPARSGIASELSSQHKDIPSRLMSQGLMRTVKVHDDFTPFLKLSDFIDPETAEEINGLVDFSINGCSIKKQHTNPNSYTLVPVRIDQPITIEVTLNRGNATSLLKVAKSKAELPSWSNSSFMKLLDLVSFRITYKRPLDRENNEYYLSNLICEQEDLAALISEPTSDGIYSLAKKYGHPGWFNINIDLPEIQIES